jgi:uncharacterized SAM-binding protein YcdF (DUF218 family)
VAGLSGGSTPLTDRAEAHGARAIVVLSNGVHVHHSGEQHLAVPSGQTAANALEGARVSRLLADPVILASGGRSDPDSNVAESEVVAAALEALRIPASRIVLESTSGTTYEQAVNLAAWLRAHGRPPFVLVTAPEHMRRAAGVFRAVGMPPDALSAPASEVDSPAWQPSLPALARSESALYEYVAWCFYRWRGWL